jgi:putative peptide zinc metalloprotease protein
MSAPFLSTSWYRVEHLKPRLRPQLRISRHRYWGGGWYVIEDPASGKVHRFTPAAWLFLGRLDGSRTVDAAWQEAAAALGEHAPTQGDALRLLGQLHGADLLEGETPPDVAELMERQRRLSRQLLKTNLLGPLSLRLPLFDPDALLGALAFIARPFVGWLGLFLTIAFIAPAAFLALANWGALTENLSDRVLTVDNLILMAVIYPLMKIVHELGHGLVAKAYGASVREFGIMFLVLFPVPYVDASAASALPSKYQRAAVSAAGVIAELLLAAGAFYCWLVLEPGLERSIAFNVMAIGGVSTLLVNGNPLLRFDGYFVFADLLEVPNLASRANRYLGHLVEHFAFGVEKTEPFEARTWEKAIFLVYAPLAFLYRILVTVSICLFIATQFFIFGVLLALWSLILTFVWPALKGLWHVFAGPTLRRNRRRATLVTTGTVAVALTLLFALPVPHMGMAQGVVWLPEASGVRTATDGFVASVNIADGALVDAGASLAELELPALAARYEGQVWRVRELELKLAQARTKTPAEALVVAEELDEAVARLRREEEIRATLTITAPAPGRFIAARSLGDLSGIYLRQGELIGHILPQQPGVIRAVVGQDEVDLVRGALRDVELRFAEGEAVTTRVLREVPSGQFALPSAAFALASGGTIATDPRDPDGVTALRRVFQLDLALPPDLAAPGYGGRVAVRFRYADMPIGQQLGRWLRRTLLETLGGIL